MPVKQHLQQWSARPSTWFVVIGVIVSAALNTQPSAAEFIEIPLMAAFLFFAQFLATRGM